MDEERTILPLKEAYRFGAEHGLKKEFAEIRDMEIEWDHSYTSSLRRGYVVDLLTKKGLFEVFKEKYWSAGNTSWGRSKSGFWLRLKARYEDFLAGGSGVIPQVDDSNIKPFLGSPFHINPQGSAMSENEELEFETPLEEEIESIDVPSEKRKIYTELADPEIESLHGKFKRGKLIVQPDFQRQFVWDTAKASRLIESALLGIPIPLIYISQEPDNKEYVIDGQQRLTSFFSYIDRKFPDGTDFKLTGLKVFRELNGKKYHELSDSLQDGIRYFNVRTITFKRESDPNLKFEIFERLNTGSVSLNDQELRNCIYRGEFNTLLKELSEDSDFTSLLGLKKPDKRMKDIELALRFAAFYHATYLNYKPPMKNFLNTEAEKHHNLSKDNAHELKAALKNACQVIRSMFGKNAFKRFYKGSDKDPLGYWEPKKFNASLYDILMYTFAREDKNIIYQNLDSVREAFLHLMTENQEFIDSIELSTSSLQAVTKRFDLWRLALQDVVGIGKKEPRCFSMELKESLFKSNNTCAICGQRIQEIDDSAIDHVKQYWTGGRTIPENARLTHRYCNWARSRKE